MMALDPSIPLGVKDVRINMPFENLAVVMEARQRENQARAQELALNRAQRQMSDEDQLRAIWQQYGNDPEQALAETQKVNPELAFKMRQDLTQAAIVNMRLQDEQLARDEAQHDKHLVRLGAIPKGDDELFQAARALAVKDDPQMDQILPKSYVTDQDAVQLERAMETGKQAREILKGRREELNRLRDDADRQANQAAMREDRTLAREALAANREQLMADRAADNARQEARDAEMRRHNLATEARLGQQASGPKMLSPTAESNIINRLSNQWTAATKNATELDRAIQLMDTGLTAARRGDMAAGSQAVLVTFQKILDPTSVVRESEYARSAAGQSVLARIQGGLERLASGGAGVPLSELEKFATLAKEASQAQKVGLSTVRERIGKTADRYSIPRELVLDARGGEPASAAAPSAPAATPSTGGLTYQDYLRRKRGGG